jgi:Holliday junction resolvase RusA-like endonuclease
VLGTPAPQGSKRALHHSKTGRIVTIESGHERVQSWREAVKAAAFESRDQWDDRTPFPGPLVVEMTFTLNRPKHHWRTGRNAHLLRDAAPSHPATKPDIDKLQRSTLDALKDAGIYRDDSQVVDIHAAKTYPDRHMDALHIPGAVVRIWSVAS